MATQARSERDLAALGRILSDVARPAERLILKRDINGLMDETVGRMHGDGLLYSEAVREFKKRFLLSVLRENGWNMCRAARELGMHRNTLARTCADLGINVRYEARTAQVQRKQARRAGIIPGSEHKVIS